MRSDLIETFKIINGISIYSRHFSIFLLELKIYLSDSFANQVIYFWDKLRNHIKNSNSIKKFKIKSDDFRKKKNGKKKNF